ncbi:sensor histidine kinase [Flavivirga jejuensis]|uniref:histidine kinase n=1 Tax=Flavivirga jejuensis TaxID=870487 RepID=A0ABT8WQD7_9FLAO|nr:ATP-binding protein [Flavivirga jejuensis]MDO5975116.1 ATP-binding protein [Flavivirga jejuensis]
MNSLLKRQLRKCFPEGLTGSKDLERFIDAVDRSYHNFDEQYVMQQRAMAISSDELSVANEQLKQETNTQQEVINKLKRVIETLKFYELPNNNSLENVDLDGIKLIDFIDNQTKEIVEMNKQREKLLNELAHQNQELSDYAHMVSHDLKSPLRSIDALTSWLNSDYHDKLDDSGKDNIKLIRDNVEKMDTLITGILEYSTIGKNQLESYDVDLNKIIDNILNVIEIPKHISIVKKGSLPVLIGNKYRLQQLFQNLIDNAINNNDKTSGLIEIGVKSQENFWEFYIKDNGKGIDAPYFDKIFKTFHKLENNTQSTGIGLSIVKKIIDLYDGKIWLTSQLGKGTTFYFTIKK